LLISRRQCSWLLRMRRSQICKPTDYDVAAAACGNLKVWERTNWKHSRHPWACGLSPSQHARGHPATAADEIVDEE